MCGIIGYVGPREASRVVVEGLRRMEYRGYDSAGVAVVTDGALEVRKKAGKIVNLDAAIAADPLPPTGLGIGHRDPQIAMAKALHGRHQPPQRT